MARISKSVVGRPAGLGGSEQHPSSTEQVVKRPLSDALSRVLALANECEVATGYGDPEVIRIFRGISKRIREAVYGV